MPERHRARTTNQKLLEGKGVMKQLQGQTANEHGKKHENIIEQLCSDAGCVVITYKEWIKQHDHYGDNILIKNKPYQTIYGKNGRMEFYLLSKQLRFRGRIECRFQKVKGSVDEKFPYLYHNCMSETHPKRTLLIWEGGGLREGSITWLKEAGQAMPDGRRIDVLHTSEFKRWIRRN